MRFVLVYFESAEIHTNIDVLNVQNLGFRVI
jgi:hypothetical protein